MVSRIARPLAITIVVFTGCEKTPATVDPCSNGACAPVASCELGDCADALPSLASSHSPLAGTEVEDGATCPYLDGALPAKDALLDTADIPEFKRGRSRRTNMDTGEAAPHNIDLHAQLMPVQGRIFECIDIAACYSSKPDPFMSGDLEFQFELEADGHISAVSVLPSSTLVDPLVSACARRSLFEFKLPKYDGARINVSYRVEIGEG
jgi:hypothetical protein